MARTKAKQRIIQEHERCPQPQSAVEPSTSTLPNPQPSTSRYKRRLDYDSLVEPGPDKSDTKGEQFESEKPKRMKTRSASKLESNDKLESSSRPSTSAPMPAGKHMTAPSQPHLEYFNASELPKSAWLVSKNLEWCVVNNRSLITERKDAEGSAYFESPFFNEFLEIAGLELMGKVDVRLECGEILHIEEALYIDSAKCNLISVDALKSQKKSPMSSDSDYCLRTCADHLYLFDERDGERIQLTRRVANRTVLLTRDPSIQQITDHAVKHRIPDSKAAWIKEL